MAEIGNISYDEEFLIDDMRKQAYKSGCQDGMKRIIHELIGMKYSPIMMQPSRLIDHLEKLRRSYD